MRRSADTGKVPAEAQSDLPLISALSHTTKRNCERASDNCLAKDKRFSVPFVLRGDFLPNQPRWLPKYIVL
jgi:hypothetical protein